MTAATGQKQPYSDQNRQLYFVQPYAFANSHYCPESPLFPDRLYVLGYGSVWLIAGILAYRKPDHGGGFFGSRLDTFLE